MLARDTYLLDRSVTSTGIKEIVPNKQLINPQHTE